MKVEDLMKPVPNRRSTSYDWNEILTGALIKFGQAEMDYWGSLLTAEISQGVLDGSITPDEGERLLEQVNNAETVEELQDMAMEGGADFAATNQDGR